MAAPIVTFVIIICNFAGYARSIWKEPPFDVTFTLSTNVTNPLRIGDIIEFNCTSFGQRRESTLEWMRVNGNTETRVQAGPSTLVHRRVISSVDHDTELYCATWYSVTMADNTFEYIYAKSERIPLRVRGVTVRPPTPNTENVTIWLTQYPDMESYTSGTCVAGVCDQKNMKHGLVEIRQAKRHLEAKVYVGYQTGYRWIGMTMTPSDNNTYLYCRVSTLDERMNNFHVLGPVKQVKVLN